MKLLSAQDYYTALRRAIPKAKKRITIQAMVVLWGGRTEQLLPLIEAAAKRGVEVRIVGDVFSKYEAKTAKIARRGLYFNWKHTAGVNEQLRAYGAHMTYVGKLGLNPFKGRTHSKIVIIDDMVWTFGGVNFSDAHFGHQDLMVELEDAQLAGRLQQLVQNIETGRRVPDFSEPLDATTTLLFDGGNPGQSIIYTTARDILAQAKKTYYVSKMCPSGPLAPLITATDYRCYFNRPDLEGPPENMAVRFDQARYGIKNSYKGSRHLHAKLILTENHDGSRHLITGSNNFAWRGVAFGTKEIALHSTDPTLWQGCYDFIQQEVAA